MVPNLSSAVRLSLRALRREAWLAAAGLLVAGVRRAATWPAVAVAWGLVLRAALAAARGSLSPGAALDGAAAMATSPRFLGIVGGLWLAGVLAAGALRAAWAAGALPVLGAAMAAAPLGSQGFAEGFASGFPRVLPAALLGLVLDLSGVLFGATLVGGTLLLGRRAMGEGVGAAVVLAAAGAMALTLSLAVPLALSTVADALVVRAALRREALSDALAAVTRRFLARPGGFLLGALAFGAAGLAGAVAVQTAGGVATGFAPSAPALVLVGSQAMLAAAAALVASVVDLAWLGTLAVLCVGEVPEPPTGPGSAGWRSSASAA